MLHVKLIHFLIKEKLCLHSSNIIYYKQNISKIKFRLKWYNIFYIF